MTEVDSTLTIKGKTNNATTYTAILERFLKGLSEDGRSGIKTFVLREASCCFCCGIIPHGLTENGCSAFTRTCNMLLRCVSLTTLKIAVAEEYLFDGEQVALADALLHGKPLVSQGLLKLQKLLQSLPQLQIAEINARDGLGSNQHITKKVTPFIRYASVGPGRNVLWIMIGIILEQTKLQLDDGKVMVQKPGHTYGRKAGLENYRKWLKAVDEKSEDSHSEGSEP